MERFWSKVEKGDGCWSWKARKTAEGYGLFFLNRKNTTAHRVSYELSIGKIPDGLVVDHLCRNPSCVNPFHLEAVTQQENIRRGVGGGFRINAAKTHCKQGHPFDALNTHIAKSGKRECRACWRANSAAYKRRKLA